MSCLDLSQNSNANCPPIRFLRMTHESAAAKVTIVHASPSRPDTFISTTVPAKDLNVDIMDVAFVKAVGSYPGGETELRKWHRFAKSVPLGRHWSFKYLVDLDGMSYSGRFMGLMASDSAVLKSTVYKEYFSDWIQPWSVTLSALPVIVRLLNCRLSVSGCIIYPFRHRIRRSIVFTHISLGLRPRRWTLRT